MAFVPVIVSLYQQRIPRFLTLVFEDQLTPEKIVQEAFREMFKAVKVFLHKNHETTTE